MSALKRGDLIWLNFTPQAGREQAGHRPAVVLSTEDFNRVTGFAVVCPITSHVKGYAFEVPLPSGLQIQGVALTDQFKSLDVNKRQYVFIENIPEDSEFMCKVLRNVRSILA